jgi:hypothetical protein
VIRTATAGDLPAILNQLPGLQAELGLELPFHETAARQTLEAINDSERGMILVLDLRGVQGFLLGIAQPYAFAHILAAEEIAWWIAPRHRGPWAGAMLDRFEAWAAGLGARLIGLSHTGKSASAMYRRRGYACAETKYFREI